MTGAFAKVSLTLYKAITPGLDGELKLNMRFSELALGRIGSQHSTFKPLDPCHPPTERFLYQSAQELIDMLIGN